MKVKDFSKQIGLASSKIRYYERNGIVLSKRFSHNNYRDFKDDDALNFYNVLMLRSFGMSINETSFYQRDKLLEVDSWLGNYIKDLDKEIYFQTIKMFRLKEMREYFNLIKNYENRISKNQLKDSYNVFNFGNIKKLKEEDFNIIKSLVDLMPFSYVAIRISKESILLKKKFLDVSIGLGILSQNLEKLDMKLPDKFFCKGGKALGIILEVQNPLKITFDDLKPFLKELEKLKIELKDDLLGRIFLGYQKNDKLVYGLIIGTTY